MVLPIFMNLDGVCSTGVLPPSALPPLPPSDELISIDEPVGSGFKAKNLDGDVRTIQESLNKIKPLHGGPTVPLDVDGKCGPKTNAAIQNFQFKQFGWKGTDGVIEPGKQTITRINQLLFSAIPIPPGSDQEIKLKLVSHMGLVATAIHAATTSLMTALVPAGGIDMGQARANDRIDRHFALNKAPASARNNNIRDILSVFNMYTNVLLMPGALGAGAFEMDPTGDPRIAFTFSNGFFHKGEKDPKRDIPLDRIYLGRRAFFALTDSELCAFIMLHEMAHFVGFPGGSFIPDNGRGWFTDDTIKKLTPDQRMHNADSYAAYATECRTGDPAKPPYVKASNTSR